MYVSLMDLSFVLFYYRVKIVLNETEDKLQSIKTKASTSGHHILYIHVHEIWAQPVELPMSCLGSSAGRVLCLEYRVSWVRVPPEAAHFF